MQKLAVATLTLLIVSQPLPAKVVDRNVTIGGMTVYYKVVLPRDYDPDKTYPAVLAFPPGSQTTDMVMVTLTQNWAGEAQRRGYIVVIPAAPGGRLFFEEGARVFPQFLDQLLGEYKVRDRKFHIAGMSNGGLSAFHIAALYPQYFLSVTGFPGYLPDATPGKVAALGKMCINMHVGELDTGWLEDMQQQASEFRAEGMKVRMTVEKGESHVIRALTGAGAVRLFDEIEEAAHGCGK
jgi:predicted peptidase